MEENFKTFYKTLDSKKFKYFIKDNNCYIYENDIDLLPVNLKPKSDRAAKISNIEQIIKEMLINRKVPVEEYTFLQDIKDNPFVKNIEEDNISLSNGKDYYDSSLESITDKTLSSLSSNRNYQSSSGYDDFVLFSSGEHSKTIKSARSLYKLTKKGFPTDYLDFLDLCLTESIPPTIFAVSVSDSNKVSVAFIKDSKIMECEFLDDDLYSNLYSLSSSHNCVEFLYCNKIMEKVFNTWGINCLLVKFAKCSDMIKNYMKVDFKSENFIKEDCCLLNIADFDLVDFGCVTLQGKRLLNQWLRTPRININEINQRLDLSECFSSMNFNLNSFTDLKRLSSRIYSKNLTITECIKLCDTIDQIPEILETFRSFNDQLTKNSDGSNSSCVSFIHENQTNKTEINNRLMTKSHLIKNCFIDPFENLVFIFRPLINEIKTKINFKTSRVYSHLSEKLTALETEKFEIYKDIEAEFLKVKQDFSKLSFSNRMFKISRLEYNQGNFNTQKYQMISLLKNGAHFVTKNLAEFNEKLEKLEKEIIIAESSIFDQIKTSMIEYITSIDSFNFLIALMDIYKAFSLKISNVNYSRPIFDSTRYEIYGMFHPMLEHKGVILNEISFDKDVCILTGPNMGGKSTFLKALSMVSLYAQVGCYVPAKKAILPIFDRIFLRIGARDCISQRMSTFMVEMTDLNKILRTGTSKSLVLIDELGRGTSAIDGLSLVLAVKEYLIQLKAKTVMATHFGQVGDERTLNKRMSVVNNVLTYKIEDGASESSFGIKVAEMAGFPENVLTKAKEYLSYCSGDKNSFN